MVASQMLGLALARNLLGIEPLVRIRVRLPCTCSSRPGLAFSLPTAAATALEITVVFAPRVSECGRCHVLGKYVQATAMGLSPGSAIAPQEPAKIS
jgi:hypothetical protein